MMRARSGARSTRPMKAWTAVVVGAALSLLSFAYVGTFLQALLVMSGAAIGAAGITLQYLIAVPVLVARLRRR